MKKKYLKRNLMLIINILFMSLGIFSQEQKNYQDFFNALEFDKNAKSFVDNFFSGLAEKLQYIPKQKWDALRQKVNYTPYYNELLDTLEKYYTIQEINEIFAENETLNSATGSTSFIYPPKEEVSKDIYKVSKRFGQFLNQLAAELIGNKNNNFSGLTEITGNGCYPIPCEGGLVSRDDVLTGIIPIDNTHPINIFQTYYNVSKDYISGYTIANLFQSTDREYFNQNRHRFNFNNLKPYKSKRTYQGLALSPQVKKFTKIWSNFKSSDAAYSKSIIDANIRKMNSLNINYNKSYKLWEIHTAYTNNTAVNNTNDLMSLNKRESITNRIYQLNKENIISSNRKALGIPDAFPKIYHFGGNGKVSKNDTPFERGKINSDYEYRISEFEKTHPNMKQSVNTFFYAAIHQGVNEILNQGFEKNTDIEILNNTIQIPNPATAVHADIEDLFTYYINKEIPCTEFGNCNKIKEDQAFIKNIFTNHQPTASSPNEVIFEYFLHTINYLDNYPSRFNALVSSILKEVMTNTHLRNQDFFYISQQLTTILTNYSNHNFEEVTVRSNSYSTWLKILKDLYKIYLIATSINELDSLINQPFNPLDDLNNDDFKYSWESYADIMISMHNKKLYYVNNSPSGISHELEKTFKQGNNKYASISNVLSESLFKNTEVMSVNSFKDLQRVTKVFYQLIKALSDQNLLHKWRNNTNSQIIEKNGVPKIVGLINVSGINNILSSIQNLNNPELDQQFVVIQQARNIMSNRSLTPKQEANLLAVKTDFYWAQRGYAPLYPRIKDINSSRVNSPVLIYKNASEYVYVILPSYRYLNRFNDTRGLLLSTLHLDIRKYISDLYPDANMVKQELLSKVNTNSQNCISCYLNIHILPKGPNQNTYFKLKQHTEYNEPIDEFDSSDYYTELFYRLRD